MLEKTNEMKKILFIFTLILSSFSFPKKCYQSTTIQYNETCKLELCTISPKNSYISSNERRGFEILFGKIKQKDSIYYDFLSDSKINVGIHKPFGGEHNGENAHQYYFRRANSFFYFSLIHKIFHIL